MLLRMELLVKRKFERGYAEQRYMAISEISNKYKQTKHILNTATVEPTFQGQTSLVQASFPDHGESPSC